MVITYPSIIVTVNSSDDCKAISQQCLEILLPFLHYTGDVLDKN